MWLYSVSGVIWVVSYLPKTMHCVFCGEISRLSGMSWLCMVLIAFCRSARAFCACLWVVQTAMSSAYVAILTFVFVTLRCELTAIVKSSGLSTDPCIMPVDGNLVSESVL